MKKSVVKEIDKAIKDVWLHEICEDYRGDGLLREASLQCALYHHLRNRLKFVLEENDLRIYSEYTFKEERYRADLVIAHVVFDSEISYLEERVDEIVAIIELKYVSGGSARTIDWVRQDIFKMKDYAQKYNGQLYLGIIYENDCGCLNWMDKRSTNNWADGIVTELNAGWINEEFCFEVNSYNHINYQCKSVACNL